ncbi:MAG: acyl-CoA desaturase, partial [Verrucomicrobiota bacterium]
MSQNYCNPRMDFDGQPGNASHGVVDIDPVKAVWVALMLSGGIVGAALTITPAAVLLFVLFTLLTLCLGHSLGMHRYLIHNSFACHRWFGYLLIHLGTVAGIAGPLGMLRAH